MAEKGFVDCVIKNAKETKKKIQNITAQVSQAEKLTVSDMRKRAPTVIRRAMQERYTVSASQVSKAGGKPKKSSSTAGKIKLHGANIENLQIVYSGQRVTPALYKITPKARNGKKKQKIKVEIIKGQKKELHPESFLGKAAGTIDIPYVRKTQKRLPIQALYTVAVPQMVTNDGVSQRISEELDALLLERLQHNTEYCTKKMIESI